MGLYIILTLILAVALFASATSQATRVAYTNLIQKPDKAALRFKRNATAFVVLFLLVLWALTAFRAPEIGNDTINYINFYNTIGETGIHGELELEIGYKVYCLILNYLGFGPRAFLIITATICWLGVGIYILKYSKNILFSLCLAFCFCFSNFTNILRQDLAMVIILYVYVLFKHKKYIPSLLLLLIAGLFHNSAFCFILIYFYKFFPKKPLTVFILCAIIVLASVTGLFTKILVQILPIYSSYFYSEYGGTGYLAVTVSLIRNSVFYIILYSATKYLKDRESKIIYGNGLLSLFFICFGFTVNLFSRINFYFLFPMIVDIPNSLYSGKFKSRNFWIIIIGLILLAYFVISLIIRPEWNNLYPYKFW